MEGGSSSNRPMKRSRLSTEEPDEKPFKEHPTLYLDDGNVIITAGKMLFRVHISLLSKHSTVFRDLIRSSRDQFRDMVHLTVEDQSEDMEALLNVIYGGMRVDVQVLTIETFPHLACLLRIAKKYQVERPCEDILALFRNAWPCTLQAHDAANATFTSKLAANPHLGEDLLVHPAAAIALLRECGYNDATLLFPLFYSLSRRTWQFGGAALGHHLAPLSAADIERFIVGLEQLRTTHTRLLVSAVLQPHTCGSGLSLFWSAYVIPTLTNRTGPRRPYEPLEEWEWVVKGLDTQRARFGYCGDCSQAATKTIEGYRQSIWASLPQMFELA